MVQRSWRLGKTASGKSQPTLATMLTLLDSVAIATVRGAR